MRKAWTLLLSPAVLTAAGTSSPARISPAADAYLQRAIDLIRQHHRNSAKADWPRLIANARARAAGAEHPRDTHPAIRTVLADLHEPHSFLVEASAAAKPPSMDARSPDAAIPGGRVIESRFGLVRVPALNTLGLQGESIGTAYAATLRGTIERIDRSPLCGWIIDLRANVGGNMWPMLRGLDPLLGASPFGYFVSGESRQAWLRVSGAILPGAETLAPGPPAFRLTHETAPLAVLIGPKTASSGEMTALALIGRARVRTFGAPSAGFTSANKVYPLSDGAFLVLTETSVADRTGRVRAGPLVPDELTPPGDAEAAATRWLGRECAGQADR